MVARGMAPSKKKIDEGIQRSSLAGSDILYSIWPRALPAVSRLAGTDFTVGVCASVTHSDLPRGLLLKNTAAFTRPLLCHLMLLAGG